LIYLNFNKFKIFIFIIRIIGTIYYSIINFLIIDLKLKVAISSIIYINLSLIILSFMNNLRLNIRLVLNYFHSFRSLLIFLIRYIFRVIYSRRLIILNQGILTLNNSIVVVFFILIIINLNLPYLLRFIRELFLLILLFNLNKLLSLIFIVFFIRVFFYNLFYFINSFHKIDNYRILIINFKITLIIKLIYIILVIHFFKLELLRL
jgi:NADH:ubiquinone oxidoreductase subunit 4 (subunit M)